MADNEEYIERLNSISIQINRYFAVLIFVFGSVGNILNCLVLSQQSLRSNPCAVLFLVSSFIDLISILVGLTPRILAGWNLDPTATIDWMCKLRTFITFSTRTMAIWLITLATLDRWLLSSPNHRRRKLSSLKNVKLGMHICIILSILFYVHMFNCYEANLIDQPLKCYGKTIACRLATDIIYVIMTIFLPSTLMVFFGILIVSNVRYLRMRTHKVSLRSRHSRTGQFKLKRTDHHLLRMLLVQVLLLIIFCIPQAIQKFYITFKRFLVVDERAEALNRFLYNIEVLLAFIASGMPFYLYTLSGGTVFREASKNLFKKLYRKFKCCS
ncbi:unnamed protein product [Adineta ricciae]|uniref:G-protein coupled receptors family 1 profile domain-containing protein n=1 Tax=Adineta ricciae TaxID=249248 RepID=A0A813UJS1_ADIRI|nr:unnamed protein product [Adineta ricciae]CAF1352100.1 unnamed protein product [Adineta ricciae]